MRFCLMKAIVLIDDLVSFARRQAILQEIVLSDPVIVQHGKAVPVTESIQYIWDYGTSSAELHGGYVKVRSS